jgi:hypothetical protein
MDAQIGWSSVWMHHHKEKKWVLLEMRKVDGWALQLQAYRRELEKHLVNDTMRIDVSAVYSTCDFLSSLCVVFMCGIVLVTWNVCVFVSLP